VDVVKAAQAKYRQDRGPLVCVESTETSTTTGRIESWHRLLIYVDSDLSMRTHVSRTVSSCFHVLRQLRSIRRSTSQAVLLSLVVSLVLSRLDYGNATLAGLPGSQLDRLQSVMNAAARLVCSARKYEHITPLLRDLHWLRVPERIECSRSNSLCSVLTFRCLHATAPPYLASELRRLADMDPRKRLRSASTSALVTPSSCRTTIGGRAFFVAAPRAWNTTIRRHCV